MYNELKTYLIKVVTRIIIITWRAMNGIVNDNCGCEFFPSTNTNKLWKKIYNLALLSYFTGLSNNYICFFEVICFTIFWKFEFKEKVKLQNHCPPNSMSDWIYNEWLQLISWKRKDGKEVAMPDFVYFQVDKKIRHCRDKKVECDEL